MTRRQKRGCALLVVSLVLVLSAMALHLAERQRDALAGENAQILLRQLELNRVSTDLTLDGAMSQKPQQSQNDAEPVKEYLGYSMIGTLRIPSVGIELPILDDWSDALLNVAPCRYSGSVAGNDMILMGHNYRSHFTPLHGIALGAAVEFRDVNGVSYHYTVAAIEYLHKSQAEELPSAYPLTLFTCTAGGQNRIIVRCDYGENS